MPIYAYKCTSCGHAQDVLQKISDPLLTTCPQCGRPDYVKQVTAAGFQLKGSGWYVTDFRNNGSKPASESGNSASSSASAAPAAGASASSAETAKTTSGDSASSSSSAPAASSTASPSPAAS